MGTLTSIGPETRTLAEPTELKTPLDATAFQEHIPTASSLNGLRLRLTVRMVLAIRSLPRSSTNWAQR